MTKGLQHSRFRLSSYTIFVNLEQAGDFLLVHGYTGAIDYIDVDIAKVLRSGQYVDLAAFEAQGIDQAKQVIERLVSRGYLTMKTPLEEKEWVAKFANHLHGNDRLKSNFLFLVAYDCNFRCPYCFENEISDTGKGWSKKVISKDLVDKAYDSMQYINPDPMNHVKEIILYGGEPLLKENLDIVEYIIEKGMARGFHFKAITNGYDLDSFLHLLGPKKLAKLQITIDGVKEKHDTRRTHHLHGNSFDKIVNNVQVALDLGTKVSIRINTELNNFDEISKLYNCFKALKFTDYPNFRVYSALIHGEEEMNCNTVMAPEINTPQAIPREEISLPFNYDPDAQYIDFEGETKFFAERKSKVILTNSTAHESATDDHIRTMHRGKFIEKFNELTTERPELKEAISCQDFGVRRKLQAAIKGDTKMAFTSVFCTAQTGMLIFDPYGDLYTCWEVVGQDYYKVGSYGEGWDVDEDKLAQWYNKNISKVPACSKCKYALFCGGGCMAHAIMEGRGFNAPYCDGFPKTFHKVANDLYKDILKE